MDISKPETQAVAFQNFERQLSSLVMHANMTASQFEKELWLYIRHLPEMQPYLSFPVEDRLAAAIEHYGDLEAFSIEPYEYYGGSKDEPEPEERYYIGFTDSLHPEKPLIIDGFTKHKGNVRKALASAIYLLLHSVGCYNCNDDDTWYDDETEQDDFMPELPNLSYHEKALKKCAERNDELGDWLRSVMLVSAHFNFESIRSDGEEVTEADSLFPIVYKAHSHGYSHIEMWKSSGWPYNPCGQFAVVTKSGLISEMPPINPEKYLMKIFSFNLETLCYEL